MVGTTMAPSARATRTVPAATISQARSIPVLADGGKVSVVMVDSWR